MRGRFVCPMLVLAGVISLLWHQNRPAPLTISGIIEADEIRIGSRIGGRVHAVLVQEGDTVQAGQTLVHLEPFDLYERLAEAHMGLAIAQLGYERLQTGYRDEEKRQAMAKRDAANAAYDEAVTGPRKQEIEQTTAHYKHAVAELALAKQQAERTKALYEKHIAAKEDFDTASSKLKVAQALADARYAQLHMQKEGTRTEQLAQAQARLAQADAEFQLITTGFRAEEIEEAKHKVHAAQARVNIIHTQLVELDIVAPAPSVVEALDLQPGELIPANAPVITLMDRQRLWLRAYVPATLLGLAALGANTGIVVDGFPHHTFRGRVAFVAHQAEFTPSNVQTPEERSQQVFRIKVQLMDGLDVLRPGMGANLSLESGENAHD